MKYVISLAAFLMATGAQAQDISGVWQTNANDEGAFLHVTMEPCGDKVCGSISGAFNKELERAPDYEHQGKKMIWDMSSNGDGSWSGGKIWAPDDDKTYSSKMKFVDGDLKVSGCVAAILCRSYIWRKVQ